MSDRYKGAILSPTAPTVTPQSAGGVFTLSQQTQYQGQGVWPNYGTQLTKSLRFRRSASAYLNRTPASASNRRTYTWSGWVKLGSLDVARQFFGTTGGSTQDALVFSADNQLVVFSDNASQTLLRTAQLFRDPSAWYHVVVAVDTTQATSSNRVKIYVNGVQVTAFEYTQYPSQNFQGSINNNVIHYISTYDGSAWAFDGYLAEVNFIDGQALTPSSFGMTNAAGTWSPIGYSGSYGTNGFYLPFTNTTSTTTLGYDFSPQGNNWTTNNISLTAGSTYDSMNDVPTLTSATTANYATFNGISTYTNSTSNVTYSNGNLQVTYNSADAQIGSSIRIPNISGKFYLEFTATYSSSSNGFVGLFIPNGSVILQQNGVIGNFGVCTIVSTTGVGYSSGQTISFAIDADTKTATIRVNNTVNTVIDFSAVPTGVFIDPAVWLRLSGDSFRANYGQQPFTYTPPSGFVGLNTFNLPSGNIVQGNQYFNTVLYAGNGGSQSVTGVGFQPDWVWVKVRNSTQNHSANDSVRGPGYYLVQNATAAERFQGEFNSFNPDGFSLTYNAAEGDYNASGKTYVAWNWKASNAAAVTNTVGSISSQVSANPTAGFSIVTYTGNATSAQTVGHGLGVTPTFFILKSRGVQVWNVYSLAGGVTGNTILQLNDTSGAVTGGNISLTASSTTIGFGSASQVNGSGVNFVAYVFAPVAGYSAMGSYTGNGSTDGPFIFTGFRPRFVMFKGSSIASNWCMLDSARNTYNLTDATLQANSSAAELTNLSDVDFLSNGIKIRDVVTNDTNVSGQTYIYMAFAENPFKYANAR